MAHPHQTREFTVGEILDALAKYPRDKKVLVLGADCGGYDVCVQSQILVSAHGGLMTSEEANLFNGDHEYACSMKHGGNYGTVSREQFAQKDRKRYDTGGEHAYPANCVLIFGIDPDNDREKI